MTCSRVASQVVERREDTEQTDKYSQIVDLLVAAGYFRARIKGLSPFDQVHDNQIRICLFMYYDIPSFCM